MRTDTPTETPTIRTLRLTTAYISLVTGGTLFAFSTFVMPGLRQLPAPTAVAAMQAINAQAPRSLLLVPLLGSAVGGAALVVVALTRPTTPGRGLLLLGGLAAVATMVITGGYHVPHNDALALLQPDGPDTPAAWARYADGWTAWNHVRTATALLSGLALLVRWTRPYRPA
jgi:uncharacterized membrane protein